jgi:hypothetical protein
MGLVKAPISSRSNPNLLFGPIVEPLSTPAAKGGQTQCRRVSRSKQAVLGPFCTRAILLRLATMDEEQKREEPVHHGTQRDASRAGLAAGFLFGPFGCEASRLPLPTS